MSKPRTKSEWPKSVVNGSVTVKVYKVKNKAYLKRNADGEIEKKERFGYMVSYFAQGRRIQKMFADPDEAVAEAIAKADTLANGEMDALALRAADARVYVHAVETLKPTGIPLDLAVRDYVEAWKILGGKASLLEAAKEFAR